MQRNSWQVAVTLTAACILSWAASAEAQLRKLGPVFQVNSTLTPNSMDPAVERSQDGFVAVWESGQSGVLAQRFDAAGAPVGPEFGMGDSEWIYQAISSDPQGGFLAVWEGWEGSRRRLFAHRFNAMGEPLGSPIPVGDDRAYWPAIVQDMTGGFGVFWVQFSTDQDPYFRLFAQWFSRDDVPRGDPYVITQGDRTCDPWDGCGDFVSGPAAARDPAGNSVVVWSEFHQVRGLRFNREGEPQAGRFYIGAGYDRPSVDYRENGNFQVVWNDLVDRGGGAGHQHVIFGKQFSPGGGPLSGAVLIQSSDPCSAVSPRVRADNSGHFVVLWYEQCNNDNGRPVRSRALSASGEPVGAVLGLSRPAAAANQSPALSRTGNGGFIAAWAELGATRWNIFGQRLRVAPDLVAINAGLSDAWYDPQSPGQGFFITVLPELESIFLAWFTFDTERPSANITAELGEPGHRWLTAFGDYSGGSAVLDVELTSGGIFAAAQPAPLQTPAYGTITLKFSSCNRLELAYDLPALPRLGVIELQRISDDKVALCEELSSPW